jgi:hypothetical protein
MEHNVTSPGDTSERRPFVLNAEAGPILWLSTE